MLPSFWVYPWRLRMSFKQCLKYSMIANKITLGGTWIVPKKSTFCIEQERCGVSDPCINKTSVYFFGIVLLGMRSALWNIFSPNSPRKMSRIGPGWMLYAKCTFLGDYSSYTQCKFICYHIILQVLFKGHPESPWINSKGW